MLCVTDVHPEVSAVQEGDAAGRSAPLAGRLSQTCRHEVQGRVSANCYTRVIISHLTVRDSYHHSKL